MTCNGSRLELVQFHWHRSSEHTFDGRHHAMEVHLVHKNRGHRCGSAAGVDCHSAND